MKLVKSTYDRVLAGVCGGIGNYIGLDATVVRVLFAISLLFSFGTTALVYLILAFIIPAEY
jgi:phage shock protein C